MKPTLRLVKVIVQPIIVLDDGQTLTEVEQPPVTIPADEWPTYSSERFPRELADWQSRLSGSNSAGPSPRTSAGS